MPNVVIKHGFPAVTPEDEAKRFAIAAAEAAAAEQGLTLDSASIVARVVRTTEHEAAGEYLVRVDAMTRPA